MPSLALVSLALDILLVGAAIAAYIARPRIGGQMAKGMRLLLAGVMVLGFAHLIETSLFTVFNVGLELNEVWHRLFVGSAFVLVIAGFLMMRRAFEE